MDEAGKLAQRLTALEAANAVRTRRKELKQRLAIGQEDARQLLIDPPGLIAQVELGDFLVWCPKIATSRMRAITRRSGVSSSRPLVSLTARERADIAQRIPTIH